MPAELAARRVPFVALTMSFAKRAGGWLRERAACG